MKVGGATRELRPYLLYAASSPSSSSGLTCNAKPAGSSTSEMGEAGISGHLSQTAKYSPVSGISGFTVSSADETT